MWRYMSTVKNPNPSTNKRENAAHEYENTKRKRTYRPQWETQWKWLRYDGDANAMFCTVCREMKVVGTGAGPGRKRNIFYDGTDNFRVDSVKAHGQSDNHMLAMSRQSASEMKPGTSQAEKMLKKMNAAAVDRLKILFRNAHAIAKQSRPFTDFVWLADLDVAKGIDVGPSYRTDKSARKFMHFIADVERQKIKHALEKAKFVSVISDGTTDLSVTEAEIVYIRYSCDGATCTDFVGVKNVVTANATSIKTAIMDCLYDQLRMDSAVLKDKLVGFGSDGAAVMLGKNNGVAKLLKDDYPTVQAVHCTAHRLELAYKDAVKKIPLCTTLSSLLQNLYLFYRNSSKNRSALKVAAEANKESGVIPTRAGGTRWLPHLQRALQHVINGHKSLISHLHQIEVQPGVTADAQAKSRNFRRQLLRKDVMKCCHFMLDITQLLSKVSFAAQLSSSTVADVSASIASVIATLSKYQDKKTTPKLKDLGEANTFKGETLTGSGNIENTIMKVTQGLLSSLHGRFSDMTSGLLHALRISSFKFWPASKDEMQDFGNKELRVLVQHFKPTLQTANVILDEVEMEWDMLKARVYARHKVVTEAKWEEILPALKEELPNITAVIDLILTIPASSADAERGFSRLKLLKSKYRTALKEDRVTDQLFIIMQSPSIEEFDPVPAIDLWNKGGLRARRVPRDQVSSSDDDDIEEDEEEEDEEDEEDGEDEEEEDSDDVEEQEQDEEEEEEEQPDSTTSDSDF